MLKTELKKIGLSEKAANVYLAAIELGPSPVQKIAQKAKVKRTTTYVVIEDLMERGLMSTFREGKKTYFVAEKPEKLLDHIEDEMNELNSRMHLIKKMMPELNSMFHIGESHPRVRYYEGVENIKKVYREFYDYLKKKETVYLFIPLDEFQQSRLFYELDEVTRKRVEMDIELKIIYTSKKGRNMEYEKERKKNLADCLYIDNKLYPFHGGVSICCGKIFMVDYVGKLGGVVIENATLAQALKMLFKFAWRNGNGKGK